jgi:hypothetical protein
VNARFGSLSQLTVPELATLIYLYWKIVPGNNDTVYDHRWFDDVYPDADKAGADPASQFPSCGTEPATLIVCPTTVVTISLKVTATLVAAMQVELVVEALDVVDVLSVEPADEVPLETVDALEAAGAEDDEELDPPEIAISAQVRYI